MKSATPLTPLASGFKSGIQFSILHVLGSLIPKEQKNYMINAEKSGRHFTAATQHVTLAVVIKKIILI